MSNPIFDRKRHHVYSKESNKLKNKTGSILYDWSNPLNNARYIINKNIFDRPDYVDLIYQSGNKTSKGNVIYRDIVDKDTIFHKSIPSSHSFSKYKGNEIDKNHPDYRSIQNEYNEIVKAKMFDPDNIDLEKEYPFYGNINKGLRKIGIKNR